MVQRLIFLICAFTSVAAAQSAPPRRATPRKDIPAIAKATNGSVISIVMSDKDGKPIAQGSGFVVSKNGLIVTNYHVIAEGSSAVVKLPDGAFYAVDGVLTFDKARDLAVIKAHGQNFRTLTLGDSDRVQVGEAVVAIGNPLSLESTVSNGIVSGMRTVKEESGKFLQITAPISPGSSGGPLFNMAGEVIGITTASLKGGANLNFAIPINDVKRLLATAENPGSVVKSFPNEPERKEMQSEATHEKLSLEEEQKICSKQANKVFREMINTTRRYDGELLDPISHYDPSKSICYVELATNVLVVDGVSTSISINDAFGSGRFGAFYQVLPGPGRKPSVPLLCEIYPSGHSAPSDPDRTVNCKSEAEFHRLALIYFGISR